MDVCYAKEEVILAKLETARTSTESPLGRIVKVGHSTLRANGIIIAHSRG